MAGRLIGRDESEPGLRAGKTHTVKAPGTETITTFFPFHSSVLSGTAVLVFSGHCELTLEIVICVLRVPQASCNADQESRA